jgi:hypothetical protein
MRPNVFRPILREAAVAAGLWAPGRAVRVLPDDLFLVSYPKSGNTWIRFLLANLLHPAARIDFSTIEAIVPDIYQNTERSLQAAPRPRIIKSHEYFDPKYHRVVYMVRDPRDVLLSFHRYQMMVKEIPEATPLTAYAADFISGVVSPHGSWGEHVGSWRGARENQAGFLLVRYEELSSQTVPEVARIARFRGAAADEAAIAAVVERCSADRMREMERTQGGAWRPLKGRREGHTFVRKARAGGWREELVPELAQRVEETWTVPMQQLGYL